jgi:hypothetical protein
LLQFAVPDNESADFEYLDNVQESVDDDSDKEDGAADLQEEVGTESAGNFYSYVGGVNVRLI